MTAAEPGCIALAALALLVLLGGVFYPLVDQGLLYRWHFTTGPPEWQKQILLAWMERLAASHEPIQQQITKIRQDQTLARQYLPQTAPASAPELAKVRSVVEAAKRRTKRCRQPESAAAQ